MIRASGNTVSSSSKPYTWSGDLRWASVIEELTQSRESDGSIERQQLKSLIQIFNRDLFVTFAGQWSTLLSSLLALGAQSGFHADSKAKTSESMSRRRL